MSKASGLMLRHGVRHDRRSESSWSAGLICPWDAERVHTTRDGESATLGAAGVLAGKRRFEPLRSCATNEATRDPTKRGVSMTQTNPDALLEVLGDLQRLEGYPRTGWLRVGVVEPESVAAHTYGVAMVAMWLVDHVEADLDAETVLRIALLHDVGEAVTTDLPRPVKELVGREQVDRAEREAAESVVGETAGWMDQLDAYQEQSSPEATLVKAADRIQMLAKSLQYDRHRRGDVAEFWEKTGLLQRDWPFPLVERIFERLAEHYRDGTWAEVASEAAGPSDGDGES
jgi:putative hydrolase of HD superfamily